MRLDKIRKLQKVIAKQTALCEHQAPLEIVMCLGAREPEPDDAVPGLFWQIDLPGLGGGVHGRTPKEAFREALKFILAEDPI